MQFKNLKEPVMTGDPYYDLFDGGYIKPEKVLEDKNDVKRVKDAIKTIKEFMRDAEIAGVIEVI